MDKVDSHWSGLSYQVRESDYFVSDTWLIVIFYYSQKELKTSEEDRTGIIAGAFFFCIIEVGR